MKSAQPTRFYLVRWIIADAAIGAMIMLIAWQVALSQSGPLTFTELHERNPVMWVVDLLPTILGLAGIFIGTVHRRLVQSRRRTEELAQRIAAGWTADLHAANLALAESLEERQRFYSIVSHEMRTPLTAIVGYADLTEELEVRPGEVGGYLEEIYGAAGVLLELVNDLLEAAKLNTGGIAVDLQDIDGNEVAADVARRLEPLAVQKGLAIGTDFATDSQCRADPARLRQVLTNLVANAIKYSDSGEILLSSREDVYGVFYAIEDQGAGIASDELERIFEPFEQSDLSEGRRDSTGIGLAVSRTFAQTMDGYIVASSPGEGQGSTFTLWLPKATGLESQKRLASVNW